MRALARLCYGVVRPVVRPAMWRIRGFMLADILPQMQVIGHQFTEIKGPAVSTHSRGRLKLRDRRHSRCRKWPQRSTGSC
jgi:hypothetical protein